MAHQRKNLKITDNLKFRVKMAENWVMPDLIRRGLVKHVLRDANCANRYQKVGEREVLFIHVPKTGGTSLANSLSLPYGHIPASRYWANNPERFENSFSFAFVRNPWDRLYSAFNYLFQSIGINTSRDVLWAEDNLQEFEDFEHFVLSLKKNAVWHRIRRWPHFRNQMDWLSKPGDETILLDYVGRFETLYADTETLADILGVEIDLPHERRSRVDGPKDFTPEMIDVIGERYRVDIKSLGYDGPN
ncbi:MAG: sulfotransferase family 2 domain-containing protein [Pseudomonadota bacterium]|nr:sulfotransferase family 2 domain-containing protein [Pseudomonadota bacterium]